MTLPPFAYARPRSLEEATGLLAEQGAWPLAGGQSVVPLLAARQPGAPRPRLLVDLAHLPALDTLALTPDGRLRIGAMVRQRTVERSSLVARHALLLVQALTQVGHPSVRNRGTVVGSLAHADPAAEIPAVATALDGVVLIAGPNGSRRELSVAELLAPTPPAPTPPAPTPLAPTPPVSPARSRRLALEPGELITDLLLDPAAPGERQVWLEFAPRRFDLPLVGVALRRAADSTARITLAGIAPAPMSVISPTATVGEMTLILDETLAGADPHRARVARTLVGRALEATA